MRRGAAHSRSPIGALIVNGVALTVMTTTSFYLITAYTPTYAQPGAVDIASAGRSQLVTLLVGLSNLALAARSAACRPIASGRGRVMLRGRRWRRSVTAYPMMVWLVDDPSFSKLLAVLLLYLGLFRALQRRADPAPGRDHAGTRSARRGFSLAFVTRDGDLRRLHAGHLHLSRSKLRETSAAPALWLSLAAGHQSGSRAHAAGGAIGILEPRPRAPSPNRNAGERSAC